VAPQERNVIRSELRSAEASDHDHRAAERDERSPHPRCARSSPTLFASHVLPPFVGPHVAARPLEPFGKRRLRPYGSTLPLNATGSPNGNAIDRSAWIDGVRAGLERV